MSNRNPSAENRAKSCTEFGFELVNCGLYDKNNYGVKRGSQRRPKIITEVHDLQIKREFGRLKQHQENVTSRKPKKICNIGAARKTTRE